jgi:hypothetical protein
MPKPANPSRNGDRLRAIAEEDAKAEFAVLHIAIDAYPELFTENELVSVLADNPQKFVQHDAAMRAILALSTVGLLHRSSPLIVPSRAALRFDRLTQDEG